MFFSIIMSLLGVAVISFLGFLVLAASSHKKVPQGKVLIRTGFGGVMIASDTGIFVIPILHKVEEMDISIKTIEIAKTGSQGLICQDNIRADIKTVFFIRVDKDEKHVLQVAQTIGCARASEQNMLYNLFDAKFSEALKTAGKQFDFKDLYTNRDKFKTQVLTIIGTDLNGYVLDDFAIDYLEQTPLASLDKNNILDILAIKKIEEIISKEQEKISQIHKERELAIREAQHHLNKAIEDLENKMKK